MLLRRLLLLIASFPAMANLRCDSITLPSLDGNVSSPIHGLGNYVTNLIVASRNAEKCEVSLVVEDVHLYQRICARLACRGAELVSANALAARLRNRSVHTFVMGSRDSECVLPGTRNRCGLPLGVVQPMIHEPFFVINDRVWASMRPTCTGGVAAPAEFDAAIHVRTLNAELEEQHADGLARDRPASWNQSSAYEPRFWSSAARAVISSTAHLIAGRRAAIYVASDMVPIREELTRRLWEHGAMVCFNSMPTMRHSKDQGSTNQDDAAMMADWVTLSRTRLLVALAMNCKSKHPSECHTIPVGKPHRTSSFFHSASSVRVARLAETPPANWNHTAFYLVGSEDDPHAAILVPALGVSEHASPAFKVPWP